MERAGRVCQHPVKAIVLRGTMENDSIRSSGTNTLVDIWIDGKIRSICVSQQAIGAFVGFDRAAGMSDRDRCEFVRMQLPLVVSAAKSRLSELGPTAEALTIDVGQLPRPDGQSGDRRRADRRKADRRKVERPREPERRRSDRRQRERRTPTTKPD
jgi:hypothetical protein